MIIKMIETRIMPFGVFSEGEQYDTETSVDLSVGQAKTFVLCGAAEPIASVVIPSGEQTLDIEEVDPEDGWKKFEVKKKKVKT